jgi:hypothetical protein
MKGRYRSNGIFFGLTGWGGMGWVPFSKTEEPPGLRRRRFGERDMGANAVT